VKIVIARAVMTGIIAEAMMTDIIAGAVMTDTVAKAEIDIRVNIDIIHEVKVKLRDVHRKLINAIIVIDAALIKKELLLPQR